VLAAVAALLVSGTATAASSKSKQPCWKVLINDWYDGRIDGTYPIHCYRDALKKLPTDVDTYSSARDDIQQALQQRITQSHNGNGTTGGGTTTSGGGNGGGGGGSNVGGGSGSGGGTGGTGSGSSKTGPGSNSGSGGAGPVGNAFSATKPGSADSVPVPLIVLGGVALLLMAAGGAGFLARRMRTRKLQLASAASLPQRRGSTPPDRP
jgi:hypothetical protein